MPEAIYKGSPVIKVIFWDSHDTGGVAIGLRIKSCVSRIVTINSECHKKNTKN